LNTYNKTDYAFPEVKIIAVGNDLYGDDGVAKQVLTELQGIDTFQSVALVDGATDALGLIDHFKGADYVIIVDAAEMGEIPGTVRVFRADEVKMKIKMDHLSVHGISLAETFEIAKTIDAMPENLTIIGIEPQSIKIAQGLSPAVEKSIPVAVAKIIELNQTFKLQYEEKHA
jgi:hydrogenase maturation protease